MKPAILIEIDETTNAADLLKAISECCKDLPVDLEMRLLSRMESMILDKSVHVPLVHKINESELF